MTKFVATTAAAFIALSTAMPASAASHMDVSSLTCGEFNALSAADQDAVAAMAVQVLEQNTQAATGSMAESTGTLRAATGEEPSAAAQASEAEAGSLNGSVRTGDVGSSVSANPDRSDMASRITLVKTTCASSVSGTVLQAANGNGGTN